MSNSSKDEAFSVTVHVLDKLVLIWNCINITLQAPSAKVPVASKRPLPTAGTKQSKQVAPPYFCACNCSPVNQHFSLGVGQLLIFV